MSVTAQARPSAPPLSVAQEALWYRSLLAPDQITYNETISIRKRGSFDAHAFRKAFEQLVARHEAWRTTFGRVRGEPVQVVTPARPFDLPVRDLGHLAPEEAERQAVHLAAAMSKIPYDVRRGPLLRPRLLRFPDGSHRLYLGLHHLIFDGTSVNRVILNDLVALYDASRAGRPNPLAAPRAQYADYARWEQTWIAGPRVARRLAHWRRHLQAPPRIALPLDRPRPATPKFRGGVLSLEIGAATVSRLREIGASVGATLFQVVAAAWSLLLSRYSGEPEVVIGTVADLRQRPEFEAVVGYCVTPVVLRVDLADAPVFSELVRRVRNELLDALDNLVPFERLVRELPPSPVPGANPIYQTMIVLEPTGASPDPEWSMHQMESEVGDEVGNAKVDLELQLDERPDGHISGRLIFDRDLFERPSAARILGHWLQLLETVAARPGATVALLPMLTPAERRRVLVEWNATATEWPPGSIQELVRAQVERQPDAAAVVAPDRSLSFAELDRLASAVAARLHAAGVEVGEVVGVCGPPSAAMVVALLGVLRAGAAYALLDPALSTERRELALAGAVAVIEPSGEVVSRAGAAANVARAGALCALQYVWSATENPRSVPMEDSAMVNLARALAVEFGIGPGDAILTVGPTLFRTAAFELWMALLSGARVVMAPDGADGAELGQVIARERVTFLHASPDIWQRLLRTGFKGGRGLRALSGGGPLPREAAEQILEHCRVLWIAYGGPETGGYCTVAPVERSAPITIGRPIANRRAYVLDAHGQPVPIGVTGELVVAGDGVVPGESDAEAGVYRTGDLARWLPDGELELVSAPTGSADEEARSA